MLATFGELLAVVGGSFCLLLVWEWWEERREGRP